MQWAPAVVLLAGCYAPLAPEGAPCGDGLRPCPTGQMCNPADNRCYADPQNGTDGPKPVDGASADTPAGCVARRLLTGGVDVTSQGWTVERTGGTVTYANGVTTLTTSGNARQLLVLRNAFPPERWLLEVTAEVVQSGGHTPSNAAIALMASFHDPLGDTDDLKRMVFLDENAWGFGDGGVSLGTALKLLATYRLERTSNGGIKVSVTTSGTTSITAAPFTTNGSIAIGDQTTEAGLDSTFRITSVDLMCP